MLGFSVGWLDGWAVGYQHTTLKQEKGTQTNRGNVRRKDTHIYIYSFMYLLFPAAVPLQINIDTQNKKILPEHSAWSLAGRSVAPSVDMSGDSRAGSSADS
jgi:hypothetical protein